MPELALVIQDSGLSNVIDLLVRLHADCFVTVGVWLPIRHMFECLSMSFADELR
jgi:hypothetical protein